VERAVRDPGRFRVYPGVTIYGLVSSFSLQTTEVKVRRSPVSSIPTKSILTGFGFPHPS